MADGRARGEGHVIALFQGSARNGETACNLDRIKKQMRNASAFGAEMIVFPELFLTGYQLKEEEMRSVAEEKDGHSFRELSAAAKEAGIAVLYGYPEIEHTSGDAQYYNSAQLIDKDGGSLMNYHKLHPWLHNGYETLFTPGDQLMVVDCCGMNVGVLICYDLFFPEAARVLALKGAQLIVVLTAETIFSSAMGHMVATRAAENGVYVAYTNYAKGPFLGRSTCCDPKGGTVVAAGGDVETLVFAPIDTDFKLQWSYLAARRPALYKGIVASTFESMSV